MIVADFFQALVRCGVLILAAVYLFDVLRYTCTTLSDANLNLEFILNGVYAYRTKSCVRERGSEGERKHRTTTNSENIHAHTHVNDFPCKQFPNEMEIHAAIRKLQKSDRQQGKVERKK